MWVQIIISTEILVSFDADSHTLFPSDSGLQNVDLLKHNRTPSDVAAIISKMDAILNGAATTMGLERLHSTGDSCKIATVQTCSWQIISLIVVINFMYSCILL